METEDKRKDPKEDLERESEQENEQKREETDLDEQVSANNQKRESEDLIGSFKDLREKEKREKEEIFGVCYSRFGFCDKSDFGRSKEKKSTNRYSWNHE